MFVFCFFKMDVNASLLLLKQLSTWMIDRTIIPACQAQKPTFAHPGYSSKHLELDTSFITKQEQNIKTTRRSGGRAARGTREVTRGSPGGRAASLWPCTQNAI